MNTLARKIARLLAENTNGSFFEDELRYGAEVALGALLQIIIVVLTALILGITTEVLATLIGAVIYRRYSGGAHCQVYYRCTITTLVTYILLGYLCKLIPAYYLSTYVICITLLSVLIIHYRVPVDNPGKTITEEPHKKQLKLKSYVTLFLLLLITIIAGYFMNQKLVAIGLLLGLLWQNIALLPLGHFYVNLWDHFFQRIEELFIGEEVTKC